MIAASIGTLIGTFTGVGLVLVGLVQNLRTIPAWMVAGTLLGLGHGALHALIDSFGRWAIRRPVSEDDSVSDLE
jgi:hypothetical protein